MLKYSNQNARYFILLFPKIQIADYDLQNQIHLHPDISEKDIKKDKASFVLFTGNLGRLW